MPSSDPRLALVRSGEPLEADPEASAQADTADYAAGAGGNGSSNKLRQNAQTRDVQRDDEVDASAGASRCLSTAGSLVVLSGVFFLGGIVVPPAAAALRGHVAIAGFNVSGFNVAGLGFPPFSDRGKSEASHHDAQSSRAHGVVAFPTQSEWGGDVTQCKDNAHHAVDHWGTDCLVYVQAPSACGEESRSDDDFSPRAMCCACGGGITTLSGFVVGPVGADQCPEGSVPLTAQECKEAGARLERKLHQPFLEPPPNRTAGCFLFESTGEIHYDSQPGGATTEGRTQICRQVAEAENSSNASAGNAAASEATENNASTENASSHEAVEKNASGKNATTHEHAPTHNANEDNTSSNNASAHKPAGNASSNNASASEADEKNISAEKNASAKGNLTHNATEKNHSAKNASVHKENATQNATKKNHSAKSGFIVGSAESDRCPDGSVALTESECRQAGARLNMTVHDPLVESSPEDPQGCFVIQSRGELHFNAHPVGAAREGRAPCCRNASNLSKKNKSEEHLEIVFGAADSGQCLEGSSAMTKEECQEAAAILQLNQPFEESAADDPRGCFVFEEHGEVYYNAHPVGAAVPGRVPYCRRESASTTEASSDNATTEDPTDCKSCDWVGKGYLCGPEQDDGSYCWSYCCNGTTFPRILDFVLGSGIADLQLKRCALIGASDSLKWKGKGAEIDEHDTVIRINRLPTEQFFQDFGRKTTVYFASDKLMQMMGTIPLMGSSEEMDNGLARQCWEMPECKGAALIFNNEGEKPCPLEQLRDAFGGSHPVISCVKPMVKQLSWRFKAVLDRPATTGFMTFVTMAALCDELDVYGFAGTATSDGHVEWSEHPLEAEHAVEHWIGENDWESCDVQYKWGDWVMEEMKTFWPWYQKRVAKIQFRG